MIKKSLAALAIATMSLPAHALTATVTLIPAPSQVTLVVAGLLTLLLGKRFSK